MIFYTCHDCHHLSKEIICDFCGSNRTFRGSATLHPTRKTSPITTPALMDVHDLTTARYGYRLARGFSLLRGAQ